MGTNNHLEAQLRQALQAMPSDYQPRTEHLNADGSPQYINRLILEASPYLLQHAHNPVDWFAWSDEAFTHAKRHNKLIFLSIGYSTCHWCHVMERESFENKAIADYLNEHYIAIKIDRERRPDIDSLYMTAVTLMNGHGGWPMTVVMTPDGKPFFTATYLSPKALAQVLEKITLIWRDDPQRALTIAAQVTAAIQQEDALHQQAQTFQADESGQAVAAILKQFDALQGGFSHAPKFPHETYLFLLLDHVLRDQNQSAWEALSSTLFAMAQGGIYDQIGGGFHRYSTDDSWLVPHFEKMLYNQAHLARAYHQAYRISGIPYFHQIATETLDYMLREMDNGQGGFYSASDADSEGVEGKFFVWSLDELTQILGHPLAELAIDVFAATQTGNFESSNILYLPTPIPAYAEQHQLDPAQLQADLQSIKQRLYQARRTRITPGVDNKIISAWNGMMITTLALAGDDLQRPDYLQAARKSAQFIWSHHKGEATLSRASLAGKSEVSARQEDYAYLAQGYLALYDATVDPIWLSRAQTLTDEMLQLFWDDSGAGFFMGAAETGVPMIHRPKDWLDGAQPSGNAIALDVLVSLYHRTGEHTYEQKAEALLSAVANSIKSIPAGYATTLLAANKLYRGETGSPQYGAKGHLRVATKTLTQSADEWQIEIRLNHADGWHTNSHHPLDPSFIATELTLNDKHAQQYAWRIDDIIYPQGTTANLAFADQPLSIYQQQTTITARLTRLEKQRKTPHIIPLQLRFQSCSDKLCLPPEQLQLYHHTTGNGNGNARIE